MRKLLYSPVYGAGWTTKHTRGQEVFVFMAEYPPFIERLENHPGKKIPKALRKKFLSDYARKFNPDDLPYMGGVDDLRVFICHDWERIQIRECDGVEWVECESEQVWY